MDVDRSAKESRSLTGALTGHFPVIPIVALLISSVVPLLAQSKTHTEALKGLAPVAVLSNTAAGKAALAANYAVTGGIQTGTIRQSTLLPFAEQQQQALREAFITGGDLADLADGLGTTLGAAYVARSHYIDREHFTNLSEAVASVVAYASGLAGSDSAAGKYFFANNTTDGKKAVSAEVLSILNSIHGHPDIFGTSYGHPAGGPNADRYGNSRPFQTEPTISGIFGPDYFNTPANNFVYNSGPIMNLVDSPSYPSGHTTYGYTGSLILAVLVPQRYQEMIVRGAEYGNDRIIMGAHYAMDVLGGRTLALYDMAHLLANDPAYLGNTIRKATPISDFRKAINEARGDTAAILQAACGKSLEACAREDTGRFSDSAANEAFYSATQTYGLPVVYPRNAGLREDVGAIAPEAGYLLTAAFPSLSLQQADQILTETEGPGGGFLDNGSSFGVYSRLNLFAAAGKAAALTSSK
ncbi:MAG TPA: phosphatase PAP2 family protein [Bryobacteraceae bacterium]|nr:phosphatase PAP2 family protein [Bryobacteraceae bacterium]